MTVAAGSTLGPYSIDREIGRGGMGVVYLAMDTRLDRAVAIKTLPEHLADDPDRLARFEREAKTVAALNHPNVAQIYGVEDHESRRYLVLEYVEGQTLADRLAHGPLPMHEALDVCGQIAAGIEAAHEAGVIHRDLKPANVKITPDDKVKVLDFGLARAFDDAGSLGSDVADSPTRTSPAAQSPSIPGVILGTAPYMSPEQARGRTVDKRTDVWSFGVVLYECLTGIGPFDGESVSDSIGAVLHKQVDLDLLPDDTPSMVRHVLERCLQRDRNQRLRDIGDARFELEAAHEGRSFEVPTGPPPVARRRRTLGTMAAVALLASFGASIGTWFVASRSPAPEPRATRLRFTFDVPLDISGLAFQMLAIAPDGSSVVYSAGAGGVTHLYLRPLDSYESVKLPGTEGGRSPFFSPDSKRIAFFAQGLLKWVSLDGGAPLTVGPVTGLNYGGGWLPDGQIVFATNLSRHLYIIDSDGGPPRQFDIKGVDIRPGILRWPHALPDGKNILVTYFDSIDGMHGPHIIVVPIETRQARRLVRGADAKYVESGHLLLGHGEEAMIAPFDIDRAVLTGSLRSIGMSVATDQFGAMFADVARNGTLVYQAPWKFGGSRLAWVDRDGKTELIAETEGTFLAPRLATDGNRVVYWNTSYSWNDNDVWVHDIARDRSMPLTVDGNAAYPIWEPGGRRVTYLRFEDDGFSARTVLADGTGGDEEILFYTQARLITSLAPDGLSGVLYEVNPATNRDIWHWSAVDEPRVLINSMFNERAAVISPDGKYFAYISDRSGLDEIYVTSFPDAQGRWLVSSDGGTEARWNPDGSELFYRVRDQLMSVRVESGEIFSVGNPVELFRGTYSKDPFGNANYDVAPDGQRFLMVLGPVTTENSLMVVLNWTAELERPTPNRQ